MWGTISRDGRVARHFSSCERTLLLPSSIRGLSFGRRTLTGCGRGVLTGREVIAVVREARESRR